MRVTNRPESVDQEERQHLIGLGIYSLTDAARYIAVSPQLIHQWATGRPSRFKVFSHGKKVTGEQNARTSSVLVTPPVKVEGDVVLTFAHLIELRMVKMFRTEGVSMPVIKAAAHNAARLLNSKHPFSSLRIMTDGQRLFADLTFSDVQKEEQQVDEQRVTHDLTQLQVVMREIARVYFKDIEYDAEMATRWWLLGRDNPHAVLDPKRGFGQPIDDQTGVPLSALYALVKSGESIKSVADWYEVSEAAVEAAIELNSSFTPLRPAH